MSMNLDLVGETLTLPTADDTAWDVHLNNTITSIVNRINTSDVSAEAATRAAADIALAADIATEAATRVAADATLTTAVAAEAVTRAAAVSAEAVTRAAADTALTSAVAAEAATRAADDATLTTAVGTKVTANGAITGATKTKITYDTKGLVTAGADATTADIADSLNKRYVTDAQLVVIGNTSNSNTGDAPLTVKDEGVTKTAACTSIDFVGGQVTATNVGGVVTVTIPTPSVVVGALGASPSNDAMTASGLTVTSQPADATHPGHQTAANFVKNSRGPWSLSGKPASPHADDDEFDVGTSIPVAWTTGGTPSGTAIDEYAAFATAATWRSNMNSARPSWLLFQAAADATGINAIHKPITVGTNKLMWARLAYNSRYLSTVTGNDNDIAIFLSATSAGAPSANDNIYFFLSETNTNVYSMKTIMTIGGAGTTKTEALAQASERISFQYVRMQKIGTAIHFWAAPESGNWIYLSNLTQTYTGATLDRCGVQIINANSAAPGNLVSGIDFIRFADNATTVL